MDNTLFYGLRSFFHQLMGWTDARDLVEDEAWEALKAVLTQGCGFALTVTFGKSLWYYCPSRSIILGLLCSKWGFEACMK